MRPKPDDYPAAVEWRAAGEALTEIRERIRKYGDVPPADYAAAHERVEKAAAAIIIPPRLMAFNADDWPGRAVDSVGFTNDALRRREQWRQAQDRWCADRKLWRGDFEELQQRQAARPARRGKGK